MKTRRAERKFPLNQCRDRLREAAKQAQACQSKQPGRSKAEITFSNNGKVTAVKLPTHLADAPSRACIEQAFLAMRVSPFDGPPITLKKSFLLR